MCKMNPTCFLYNIVLSVQLPGLTSLSLKTLKVPFEKFMFFYVNSISPKYES